MDITKRASIELEMSLHADYFEAQSKYRARSKNIDQKHRRERSDQTKETELPKVRSKRQHSDMARREVDRTRVEAARAELSRELNDCTWDVN